jgi:hypothetical protein
MEADLGTGWIGWRSITGTPTTRTPMSCARRDDTGKDLIIAGTTSPAACAIGRRAGDRMAGAAHRAGDPAHLAREVEQERWTSLDRTLQREAVDGLVQIERFNEPGCNASACC